MKERKPQPAQSNAPTYPQREAAFDPSRRRFLRQVGVAAGATGLLGALGLPDLAHGQSVPTDFSVLDAHPARHDLVPMPLNAAPPPSPAPPLAPPAPPVTDPVTPMQMATLVTEDRALWIEPGYLLLVRWSRAADNTDVVAGFEGSTTDIGAYLQANVTTMDSLHNLDTLHVLESAVSDILEAHVAPATVVTLHLDHDCSRVCALLGGTPPIHDIPLPGVPPSPSWE